jgi:uncharacterized protein (DUF302 family)
MSYHISKIVDLTFDDAVKKTIEELKKEGFGVLTDIDVKAVLKKKIDVDFTQYRILGACNPALAYETLKAEDRVGLMLPCNVIVRETSGGDVEVSAIDPMSAMSVVGNEALAKTGALVRDKLATVIKGV